jgi:hypothetical protein
MINLIPKLPKKVNRTEADVDMKVAKRLVAVHPCKNWALEVKIEGEKATERQVRALRQVQNGTFLFKPPDTGRRQPFDYIRLGDADAIVCTVNKNLRDVVCVVNECYELKMRI